MRSGWRSRTTSTSPPIGSIRRLATHASPRQRASSGRRSRRAWGRTISSSRPPACSSRRPRAHDVVTSSLGLSQRLPRFGTSYSRVVEYVAYEQQQLPEQLQPAGPIGAAASTCRNRCCATSRPTARDSAARDQSDQSHDCRHASAGERRSHDGGREDGVLESRLRPGERRGTAQRGRARGGAGARQQGKG